MRFRLRVTIACPLRHELRFFLPNCVLCAQLSCVKYCMNFILFLCSTYLKSFNPVVYSNSNLASVSVGGFCGSINVNFIQGNNEHTEGILTIFDIQSLFLRIWVVRAKQSAMKQSHRCCIICRDVFIKMFFIELTNSQSSS
jgi:hypothetical protein